MSGNGKRNGTSSGNGNGGKGNNTVTCYQRANGKIQDAFEGTPCGDPNSGSPIACCQKGDTCLPNHFCYFSHTLPGASQFYVAPCTDPQHRNTDACTDRCGELYPPGLTRSFDTALFSSRRETFVDAISGGLQFRPSEAFYPDHDEGNG